MKGNTQLCAHTHLLICTHDIASCSSTSSIDQNILLLSTIVVACNSIHTLLPIVIGQAGSESRRVPSSILPFISPSFPQQSHPFHSWTFHDDTVPPPILSIDNTLWARFAIHPPRFPSYNDWTIVDMSSDFYASRFELPFTDYAFLSNIPDVTTSYSCLLTPYTS